jgi:hypothetical protein
MDGVAGVAQLTPLALEPRLLSSHGDDRRVRGTRGCGCARVRLLVDKFSAISGREAL